MKPENRARAVPALCLTIVLVVTIASIFSLSITPSTSASLPLPAGTVIRPPYLVAEFTVDGGPASLLGAWYMDHGGYVWVIEAGRTHGPFDPVCGPPMPPWNGTLIVGLLPGTYLVVFAPNPHGTIVITQAVAVYPGASWWTEENLVSTGCIPPGFDYPPYALLPGAT